MPMSSDNTSAPQPMPPSGATPAPPPQPVSRFGPIPIYSEGQVRAQAAQQSKAIWSRFREMPRVAQVLIAIGAALSLMVCSGCSCSGLVGALGNMSPIVQATATHRTYDRWLGHLQAGCIRYRDASAALAHRSANRDRHADSETYLYSKTQAPANRNTQAVRHSLQSMGVQLLKWPCYL